MAAPMPREAPVTMAIFEKWVFHSESMSVARSVPERVQPSLRSVYIVSFLDRLTRTHLKNARWDSKRFTANDHRSIGYGESHSKARQVKSAAKAQRLARSIETGSYRL